jgi:hypothetical protein
MPPCIHSIKQHGHFLRIKILENEAGGIEITLYRFYCTISYNEPAIAAKSSKPLFCGS